MQKNILKLCLIILCITFLTGCNNKQNKNGTSDGADDSSEKKEELNIIDDNYRTYYEIFLYSYCDSNGDKIGDINGLISKLDYLNDGNPDTDTDLGINGIWLMPIMQAGSYHKYDVIDYYSIDEQYGTMDDFKKLVKECDKRGIKLIIDFVFNHTSAKNEWFVQATDYLKSLKKGQEPSVKDCKYFGYYNFAKNSENNGNYYNIEGTDWSYEAVFQDQMPDLNLDNADTRKDIEKIAKYWMDLGVGGFRLDAAKEYYTGDTEKNTKTLKWFNDYVKSVDKDAYCVAEVWDSMSQIKAYYKSGIDSIFNYSYGSETGSFITTVRSCDDGQVGSDFADSIIDMQNTFSESNPNYIDAPFLSNHDNGRPAGYVCYKKNLVKLLSGLNLMSSGSSFIYYGNEVGLAGSEKDEDKRAPMPWSSDISAKGMTSGPPNMDDIDQPFKDVKAQEKDSTSVLSYNKKAVRLRNENPEIARGKAEKITDITDGNIAAITKTYNNSKIIMLYNFSSKQNTVTLDKEKFDYKRIKGYLCVDSKKPKLSGSKITLPAYSIVILK